MANAISIRVNHRFDFTGLSQFTLTTQTKEALAELEEPVEVVSSFNPADPRLLGGCANSATTCWRSTRPTPTS